MQNLDEKESKIIEIDPLEMIKMTLDLGGEPAETIANLPDEAIMDMLNTVETIKVIM